MDVTRCPLGIPGIPAIRFFGINLDDKISFIVLSVFFVAIVWFVLRNVSRSGFGKTLKAISEDEIYAQSIGKTSIRQKSFLSP
jgi:branched-chain amino acid transport system permease protein